MQGDRKNQKELTHAIRSSGFQSTFHRAAEYGLLEFHANEFAGRFLVPLEELKTEFGRVLSEVEQNGLLRHQLTDAHLAYLCIPLAKRFAVSPEVIERRLNREKLWPL